MGISAASIAEVRDTGSTTNGGYYDGTISGAESDLTQSDSGVAFTFTSTGAGNVITVTSGNASSLKIGNTCCITGGTNVNQGFFQITGRSGNDLTMSTNKAGTSVASGAAVSGTGNCGGAFKFGATTANRDDDAFFEAVSNSGGSKIYIKKGSYTTGVSVSISATGNAAIQHNIEGYNATRGDVPSIVSGNQPSINAGTGSFFFGSNWNFLCLTGTGTGTTNFGVGTNGTIDRCKISNTSGSSNRPAITTSTGSAVTIKNCEAISTNGYAINMGNGIVFIRNCYIHDSAVGIRQSGATANYCFIEDCIIDTMSVCGIDYSSGAMTGVLRIFRNTIYIASTPTGSSKGIDIASSSNNIEIENNIITGAVTGINAGSTPPNYYSDYNNIYNCTTARTNWTDGSNSLSVDPAFVDAPNGNFATGTNVQRVGFGSFPGGLSSSVNDIGAVRSDYSGWFTDIPVAKVLTSQGDFKYNSLSNNRTPTYDDTNLTNGNVKTGVSFGVSGSGTYRGEDLYDVVAADELKIGITKNQDGSSVVGTYAATERYTDVPEDKVDNGLAYRYNSLVNNRMGESTGATVVLDVLTEALLESDDSGATIEAY